MKIVKRIASVVVILLAIPLIVAAFLPTDINVEREVLIKRPKVEVFDFVRHLKNLEQYNKWALLDPQMKKEYRGTDGNVGAVVAWSSDNPEVGKSEQEIKKIVDGERIDVEIRFKEPFQSVDPTYTITESVGENETRVKTGWNGKIPYPMNLMCITVKKKVESGIETTLANLKTLLEKPISEQP